MSPHNQQPLWLNLVPERRKKWLHLPWSALALQLLLTKIFVKEYSFDVALPNMMMRKMVVNMLAIQQNHEFLSEC